ncbi:MULTISPECIES: amidohydrolase family protein [Clostridium]|uniref:amidohydrolase family protein n=1 Tax=Clostridium TaxID=1485 RepID=UPI001290051D|nr:MULTISPECIES: amidohydrolase family protein [Clostridium]MDB1940484.1 amidohydrolase family protein [Clostridium tertium]MDU4738771.1 amidohydrolase family protein [Clostridium sp.]
MNNKYIVTSNKIITVSDIKTLSNGAFVVSDGIISDIGDYNDIKSKYKDLEVIDFKDLVITPSLIDCHTHLFEYAPSTVYPVTEETYEIAQDTLILNGLMSGVTAFGEQVCGSPMYEMNLNKIKEKMKTLPLDIVFSTNSITIGFENLVNLTAVTGKSSVDKETLINEEILEKIIDESEYPGENVFINATPANLKEELVPKAGEIIYTQEELNKISKMFHNKGKKIGCHVAGEEGIKMAIEAKIDVIHHGHGITNELIKKAKEENIIIVATPLGGTHLKPNSPEEIEALVKEGIIIAIATDSYLPPDINLPWLNFEDDSPRGPEVLMEISNQGMLKLKDAGLDENEILSLITLNGAKVLGLEEKIGALKVGMKANFIASKGIPGLEITDIKDIIKVFYKGKCVIDKER